MSIGGYNFFQDEVQKGAVFAIETMASRTQTVKR